MNISSEKGPKNTKAPMNSANLESRVFSRVVPLIVTTIKKINWTHHNCKPYATVE
jgi:hypothetical protein